jgi:hypothetical protein
MAQIPLLSVAAANGTYAAGLVLTGAGVDPSGAVDSTVAIQAWLTSLVSTGKVGMVPPGTYLYSALTATGSFTMRGMGQAEGYTGGVNGDASLPGPKFRSNATSGDALLVSAPSGVRVHVRISDVNFVGNFAATSGTGVRFLAEATTSAIILDLERCNFLSAKDDNLVLEGNIFESRLAFIQCNQSVSGRGLVAKASASGALPGEMALTRITCDLNATIGCELSGGGSFNFTQLTCSSNGQEGFKATGVRLSIAGLQLEVNGPTYATLNACRAFQITNILCNFTGKPTSKGIDLIGVLAGTLAGFFTNSTAGNLDWTADANCQSLTVRDYFGGGFTLRYTDLGYYTKIINASHEYTPHYRTFVATSFAVTGAYTPDARAIELVIATVTAAAVAVTFNNPTLRSASVTQTGCLLEIDIRNTSGAAMGAIAFGGSYELAGGTAVTAPATGKRRRIEFSFDDTTGKWSERWRSTADV